ncbi:hypothetical protein [Ligilactobacillus equi]|uniref:YtxH domain-containing protein n=1 Tax=Ligilactobacillus equi DPC 6820 TaxID=1392007 RepID=V7HVT6_9LACO|nr:hypothetical protein [Ligilactobacillus equi]ETA74017.1 hypothetical protein LEQ_0599c [Ligilactobacillus equi DPC 6820]MCQ2556803.1 hypothetical protein [Ligilactobacillus sp.]
MGKKTLLAGLGLVAGTAFAISKTLTEERREKIAIKVDQMILDGREKALKYDRYLHDFLRENQEGFQPMKERVFQTADSLKNNDVVNEALDSLKQATSDLKERLASSREKIENEEFLAEDEAEADTDIVIDNRSAFSEAKESADFEFEHPTETFYPHA